MKKAIAFILCIAMLSMVPANAVNTIAQMKFNDKGTGKILNNALYLAEKKIQADDKKIEAATAKVLMDFNGNTYTLIECIPAGYYILDNQSGLYVEYSETAPSPYSGHVSDLYYGGPTYYYVKNGEEFLHTIVAGEQLSDTALAQLKESCRVMNKTLSDNKNTQVINALYGKEQAAAVVFAQADAKYIPNDSFFRNAKSNFGYIVPSGTGGICGYIAANLMLQYWQYCGKFTLPYTKAELSSGKLSLDLYEVGKDLGYSNSTWASEIANVMNTFCEANSFPEVAAWGVGVFDVTGEVDRGRPSILFGTIVNPNAGAHAVTVYGYTFTGGDMSGGSYIAHYGWNDYSEVTIIAALFGSNTCYRMTV